MSATTAKPKNTVREHLIAEREELVEFMSKLSDTEWNTPSLCEGWRVRDVAAHIIGTQADLAKLLTSGGIHKVNQRSVDDREHQSIKALLSQLVTNVQPNWLSKRLPIVFLADTWVHQQDMRWVLGSERQRVQDPERLGIIFKFIAPRPSKSKAGLKFVATDLELETGEGEVIRGTTEALIMLLYHRNTALERVEGPGKAILAERMKS